MKHADTVLFEVREHIAYITLNRPERYNATRHLEYDLLVDMVKECDRNADVRAVILSGNGKHFSVADDLDGIKVEGYESKGEPLFQHWIDKTWAAWVVEGEQINPFHEMVRTIMGSGKIYIAAVHGLCYLTQIIHPFDFVIAADNAMFSEPDILIGQPPCGGGTVLLPRLLGRRRTLEILLNPAPFSAQEAYRLGVVNKVVPLADLMAEAEALARKLIVYNPKTISLIKKLVTRAQGLVDEDLKREQMYGGFSHGLPGTGIPTGDWIPCGHRGPDQVRGYRREAGRSGGFPSERMASRILGMGDVLSLVEKAEQAVDEKHPAAPQKKLKAQAFTLEDFRDRLRQVRGMGPLDQLIGMIPGLSRVKGLPDSSEQERELKRVEASIDSMTPGERRRPDILNGSRRKRIADGSGTTVTDVNRLLKQFGEMQKMMRQLMQAGKGGRMPRHLPVSLH